MLNDERPAAIAQNGLLAAVLRPTKASEGLDAIKQGKEIEMQNKYVFDFLRYVDQAETNIKISCSINKHSIGWTSLVHGS